MFGDRRIAGTRSTRRTDMAYDAMGRVTQLTHANGLIDYFGYDLLGQKTSHWNNVNQVPIYGPPEQVWVEDPPYWDPYYGWVYPGTGHYETHTPIIGYAPEKEITDYDSRAGSPARSRSAATRPRPATSGTAPSPPPAWARSAAGPRPRPIANGRSSVRADRRVRPRGLQDRPRRPRLHLQLRPRRPDHPAHRQRDPDLRLSQHRRRQSGHDDRRTDGARTGPARARPTATTRPATSSRSAWSTKATPTTNIGIPITATNIRIIAGRTSTRTRPRPMTRMTGSSPGRRRAAA